MTSTIGLDLFVCPRLTISPWYRPVTVDTDKLRDILRHYFNVECITEWKTVLARLEAEHGIQIKFVSPNPGQCILHRSC